MTGINKIYVNYAAGYIAKHKKNKTLRQVSRSEVERTILEQLDLASFPIEYKISWYHAMLNTTTFDTLWDLAAVEHSLPASCTARYIPDTSLETYSTPSPTSSDAGDEYQQAFTEVDHSPPASDGEYEVDPAAAAFAATVPPALLIDTAGLEREDGDDGAYGSPTKRRASSSKTKSTSKANPKRKPTVSKPPSTRKKTTTPKPKTGTPKKTATPAAGRGKGSRVAKPHHHTAPLSPPSTTSASTPTSSSQPSDFVPGRAITTARPLAAPERQQTPHPLAPPPQKQQTPPPLAPPEIRKPRSLADLALERSLLAAEGR